MTETAKKKSGAVAPFYGVAATWVIYALVFNLYTVWNFLFVILLSGGVFLLLRAVCGDKEDTPVAAAAEPEEEEKSKKLPQIRKFMDYSLPTTLKLLNAYDRMSGTGVSGENIDSTIERVEKMMGTIVTAFEKQLDSLFGSEALDISTDISVLETMMAREGLTGEKMEAETTKNADGSDIKLEL